MKARSAVMAVVAAALGGCSYLPSLVSMRTPHNQDFVLPRGAAMHDITTPFDEALSCLHTRIPRDVFFSVGQIGDTTGKEQYADGGTGKLVTQGAGDMVQSALFRAGVSVVNRRDPNIPLAEQNWGIRQINQQIPTDFFISGSITSLDFLPGSGAEVKVAGVGPRYRQNRILVGLDLALTNAHTGRVVANVPLQKQLFAEELGFSAGRFFGDTLTDVEVGGMEREALQFTLRQMLSFATLHLLGQILPQDEFAECSALVAPMDAALSTGEVLRVPAGNPAALAEARAMGGTARKALADQMARAMQPPGQPPGMPAMVPGPAAVQPQAATAPAQPQAEIPAAAREMGNNATSYAARAIAAAERVRSEPTLEGAEKAANEAAQFMALAVQSLRQAAEMGLTGAEGDAAATLVEKAIMAAEAAQKLFNDRKAAEGGGAAAPAPAPAAPEPDAPIDDRDKRAGGAQP